MEKLLEGKVAFVTGGAMGMGLAAVKAFTNEGAAVAVVDNNEAATKVACLSFSSGRTRPGMRCSYRVTSTSGAALSISCRVR